MKVLVRVAFQFRRNPIFVLFFRARFCVLPTRPPRVRPLNCAQIATALRLRAEEVVFSEWVASNYMEVNEDSRLIWKAHGWWMLPWADRMSP